MNTYAKYCPNVFLAKCSETHKKGDSIKVVTKYGKENDCIVHNLIFTKDGFAYYSITRADGYNTQERAKAKAERYDSWANCAEQKSSEYYEASHEGKDFLVLAEPIKIGHHSEKRHRALIARNDNRMRKSVEQSDKAKSHKSKSEYWSNKTDDINLSMPESIEYWGHKLEMAKIKHENYKMGSLNREHYFSLTYASKEVNQAAKNLEIAKKLWA